MSDKIETHIVNGNFSYPFNEKSVSQKNIYGKVYDLNGNIFWKFKKLIQPNKLLRLKNS